MKLLFASDSFKGTLSSEKIIELLTKSANLVFPAVKPWEFPWLTEEREPWMRFLRQSEGRSGS